jgi:hypothetical protein
VGSVGVGDGPGTLGDPGGPGDVGELHWAQITHTSNAAMRVATDGPVDWRRAENTIRT